MASAGNKKKKKGAIKSSIMVDTNKNGSFVNKPEKGWIHPDEQLVPEAGISYGVRYIGCLEVNASMKTLDFDVRTALAREAIHRVTEAAGLKNATKRKKVDKKILRMLGEQPCMTHAGSNVNVTITTESINLLIMETGEIISNHAMNGVSFASGGDSDTLDFVAYVAKDGTYGRACHVFECGGGLAEDVITTVGQAFELRYKIFLANQPKAMSMPDSVMNPIFESASWANEHEYMNDRPNMQPPLPNVAPAIPPLPLYHATPSNIQVSDGVYSSVKDPPETVVYDNPKEAPLIDLTDDQNVNVYDNPTAGAPSIVLRNTLQNGTAAPKGSEYDNSDHLEVYDNKKEVGDVEDLFNLDAFDMEPFSAMLPPPVPPPRDLTNTGSKKNVIPDDEVWFHGILSRKEGEALLLHDGDFLVRESASSTGQYVLSGRLGGQVKHLLLVDPEGVVRTKEHTFTSVGHLIDYHRENHLPIVSQDSELLLMTPVRNSHC